MNASRVTVSLSAALVVLLCGCAGGTGSERFEFEARVQGTAPAKGADDYVFVNEAGWQVTLERAKVTLGPVYLNVIPPLRDSTSSIWDWVIRPAWAHGEEHLNAGRVVGEVLSLVTFDALSRELVTFPTRGTMTQEQVRTADIWFSPEPGTSADAQKIDTIALDVAGTAARERRVVRFRGALKLDASWIADQTLGTRGNQSIAAIRKVRGIPASFFPENGGALEITFDVKRLLRGADFANLEANKSDSDGTKVLVPGKAGDQVMTNLFQGLREADGTYRVRWVSP